ncbi:hypothetical protein SCHPADRAFT_938697 [Schizopora paradoxa]|uniref:DUF6534 domain-containing protein n=1 Tax=Schizopora paradoxa TaxID=27342 RepID=A0A0H2RTZ9_9AGAM|nr:hypothetical protein SCHPADRAFT_938697 [Schizopora paradoxa]
MAGPHDSISGHRSHGFSITFSVDVVSDYGNVQKLAFTPWSLAASFVVSRHHHSHASAIESSEIMLMMHLSSFFARRAFYLSQRNIIVTIFLAAAILLAFGVTLISCINVLEETRDEMRTQIRELPKEWLLDLTFGSSVISDLSIAATLCFYFRKSRSEYFEGTNKVMSILCKYTINTGIIATVWAACCLISNLLLPQSYLELTFYLSLSKVYVNAFLGSLIVRDSLRAKTIANFTPNVNSTSALFTPSEVCRSV